MIILITKHFILAIEYFFWLIKFYNLYQYMSSPPYLIVCVSLCPLIIMELLL